MTESSATTHPKQALDSSAMGQPLQAAGGTAGDALESAFRAHTDDETHFTRRMAINIGDFLGLTPMAVVWKLEKRGLIKSGSWDWFKSNGGITKNHIAEARADRSPKETGSQNADETGVA